MSKAMTLEQLAEVTKHAIEKNGMMGSRRVAEGKYLPMVKYIRPNIDTRTGDCFAISFDGAGGQRLFHTQNECRDLPESLYERVMNYLKTPV